MGILAWVGLFLACSLFWGWLVFGGGADWLEGSLLAALVVHARATAWTAEGIKAFAVLMWLGQGVWFVIGLFSKDARLVGL